MLLIVLRTLTMLVMAAPEMPMMAAVMLRGSIVSYDGCFHVHEEIQDSSALFCLE
jgi:hypothetical protein